MPYDVSGWIEILWDYTLEDEIQVWCGVINLNRFVLDGDMISNLLFGLAKRPVENAYFADRGVPQDCSNYVAEEIRSNEEFIVQYGEGDFAHTYALWSEILEHLEEARKTESYSSEWEIVFSLVEELCRDKFKPEWIRFVVWGNW